MSPDELRAHADLIADRYNIQDGEPALWRAMVHVVQSARNLADVIEYAEPIAAKQFSGFSAMWDANPQMVEVVRIARGDTTNHEDGRR